MSTDGSRVPLAQLTPTSYLVLGLLAREGPSTPYDLKRHVASTIGNFWSFPHALLYKEPPRLAELGLATERREGDGRRRRLFTITDGGRASLQDWLASPSREPTQLRDAGLLQLFFADLASPADRHGIAAAQLAVHRARLASYEEDRRPGHGLGASGRVPPTVEYWRGVTLPMGLRFERAAVAFWEEVLSGEGRESA